MDVHLYPCKRSVNLRVYFYEFAWNFMVCGLIPHPSLLPSLPPSHREYARHTAARECFEETLGIMGTSQALCMVLEDYKTNNVFKVVNQNMAYVSHFVRIPYDDYPSNFKRALIDAYVRDDSDVCIEVDEIR